MADKKDDITDLTEEKESADEEKGAEKEKKAKKPPKEPKPPQNVEPVPDKPVKRKKKKRGKLKIILIIVLVLLVAGFVVEEIMINYLGIRDLFIAMVVRLDPAYVERELSFDKREAELSRIESELDTRDKTITSRETQNDRRSVALDAREKTLAEQEYLSTPFHKREMTEQELLDIQSLSRKYSFMSPEAAAEILLELQNPDDVAAILYYMNERNAAAILTAMESDFAAEITEILLFS